MCFFYNIGWNPKHFLENLKTEKCQKHLPDTPLGKIDLLHDDEEDLGEDSKF